MWGDLTRGTRARSTAPAGRNVDKTIQFGKCGNTSGCPLRRVIQRQLDDKVADLLVAEAVGEGDKIKITVDNGQLVALPIPAVNTVAA